MSRKSARRSAYVWGSMSNTEPPDDDDEDIGLDDDEFDGEAADDDAEYAAAVAADQYEHELDMRASQ